MKSKVNIMELSQTRVLMGVLALVTMFHHISVSTVCKMYYGDMFNAFENVGVFCVGFFMFMFGYDLIFSMQTEEAVNKENVMRSTIKGKLFPLLITFFICNYAYMIVTQMLGEHYTIKNLLCAIFGLFLLNDQMWIAVEVLWLYLAAAIIYKITKNINKTIPIMGLIIVILMAASFFMGHADSSDRVTNWMYGEWWFNTLPCFLLGMIYAIKQEKINEHLNEKKAATFITLLMISVIGIYFTLSVIGRYGYWTETEVNMHFDHKLITALVQIPTVCVVSVLLVFLVQNIRLKFKPLEMSGRVYLELILLNNIFIYICSKKELQFGKIEFVVLELIFTYCGAILMNHIKNVAIGWKDSKGR